MTYEQKKESVVALWNQTNVTYKMVIRVINQVPKHPDANVRDVNWINSIYKRKHRSYAYGCGYFEELSVSEMDIILKWIEKLDLK